MAKDRPVKLNYRVSGTGPTVVLVHGYMADSNYWKKLSLNLSRDYKVIAVDLLGFGKSPKNIKTPEIYTIGSQADLLRKTLEFVDIKEPFILIGHSMGSLVASAYAIKHPSRIKKLILSNMPIFKDSQEVRKQLGSTSYTYKVLLYAPYGRLFWPAVKRVMPIIKIANKELRNASAKHSHASRQGALRALEKTVAGDLIPNLKVKTDLIIGLRDRSVYRQNIPKIQLPENVTLHYVHTGHHTPIQKPEFISELISEASYE